MKNQLHYMKRVLVLAVLAGLLPSFGTFAQVTGDEPAPTVLTLDQAIRIALSENIAIRVADKDIERAEYAKKSTYASLFPQIDGSASYSRTIKKQVMYMDSGGSGGGDGGGGTTPDDGGGSGGGDGGGSTDGGGSGGSDSGGTGGETPSEGGN